MEKSSSPDSEKNEERYGDSVALLSVLALVGEGSRVSCESVLWSVDMGGVRSIGIGMFNWVAGKYR